MRKELILFIPGLSAREPTKYNNMLVNNLEKFASGRSGDFRTAGDNAGGMQAEGAAGGAVVFDHTPGEPGAEPKQIVFREVVWGDIPRRLSELSAGRKFEQGTVLLGWAGLSFLTKVRAVSANKYQWIALMGALLVLFAWYVGVIIAVPTVLEFSFGPDEMRTWAGEQLGAVGTFLKGLSFWGVNIWAATSLLMGFFPVTALVDSACAMKQYLRDSPSGNNVGFVGEDARARVSNALKVLLREQAASGGPAYSRITILTHSFGVAPALEALSEFGADFRGHLRLVTLGAPLSFIGALREEFRSIARQFCNTGKSVRGTVLHEWRGVWSKGDYISSDPGRIRDPSPSAWPDFRPEQIPGTGGFWLFNNHSCYFHENRVAEILLEPLPPQAGAGGASPQAGQPAPVAGGPLPSGDAGAAVRTPPHSQPAFGPA